MGLRFVSFLVALAMAFASFAADSPPLRTAERFWGAYARGDVAATVAQWQPGRAERFQAVFRRETELRCRKVLRASLRLSEEQPATAKVEVDAVVESVPRIEEEHYVVDLRFDGSRWNVAGFDRGEDLLADELVRTPAAGRRALLDAHGAPRTPRLAVALARCAILLVSRQRDEESLAMLALARGIAEDTASDDALSAVLAAESVFQRRNPQPGNPSAIELAEEAERLALRSGDPDAVARARVRLARALESVDLPRAEAMLLSVIESADTLFEPATISTAASQLASIRSDRNHVSSFRFALLASQYAELSGDPSARLNAALNLAGVYDASSDVELNRAGYQRVVAIARESGAAVAEMLALTRLAEDDPDPALLERARELIACIGEPAEAYAVPFLVRSVVAAIRRNQRDAARKDLAAAHALLNRIAVDPRIRVEVLAVEADLLLTERDPVHALEVIEEARALLDAQPGWDPGSWWCGMTGQALRMLGRRDEAIAALRDGAAAIERGRASLPGDPRARQSYFRGNETLHDDLVALLVESGKNQEALAVADQSTARTLLDFVRSPARAHAPDSPEVERAERAVVELNRAILSARPDDPSLARTRERLAEARLQLDDVRIRSSAEIDPLSPAAAVAAIDLAKLARRSAIVRYVVAERETFAFVIVNRDGTPAVTVHRLAAGKSALATQVQTLLDRIAARDSAYRQPARALHELLFAPLLADLRDVERVAVIPDGPLGALPFQTLVDAEGRDLLTRFELRYAPSLSWCLRGSELSHRPGSVLTVGDPRISGAGQAMFRSLVPGSALGQLPDAAREAREIARLYPRSRVLTGNAADEAVLKEELPRYDVVHLATHALIDETQPLYSSLVLAARGTNEDGLLEARELQSLDLPAQLFVLSACSTARGRNYRGEGVVGLAWALLSRGVPRVVVSQWNADSKATGRLMVLFHRHLVAGAPPAAALRQAQLELRRDVRYEDPLYWAPFVVLGS